MSRSNKGAIALMALLVAVAFTLAFPGMLWAAGLAHVPPTLRPLAPVLVDAGLVVFGWTAAVQRQGGRPARFSWTLMTILTGMSAFIQFAHASGPDVQDLVAPVIGPSLAVSFALMVLSASHVVLTMTVGAPVTKARRKAAAAIVASSPRFASAPAAVQAPIASAVPAAAVLTVAAPPRTARRAATTPDPRLARALEMHDVEGRSYAEVATELDWHLSAVKRAFAAHKASLVADETQADLAA